MAEAVATTTEQPGSPEEAAALLRSLGEAGRPVRVRGGGTKLDWGGLGRAISVELLTGGLDEIAEHNVGDFTAVVQAGVPVATAQKTFHDAGQMLALDPPLGADSSPPRTPARCATATAACATSSSASRSRCRTARWPRPAAR
jgi:FAD/FMN-containing dehydrogenase